MPANCPRCQAPLYPGYTRCGNCGFDSAQPAWGPAPVAAARPSGSKMPLLLAIGGVVLLAGAGVVAVLAATKTATASTSPAGSIVAQASSSRTPSTIVDTPIATEVDTPTPKATATPHPKATSSPTHVAGTPEPSPLSAWSPFTAPDGLWSVRFPTTMTPVKQTMALNSGIAKGDMTMYMVADGGNAYAMVFFDFPAGTIPAMSSSFLKMMESSMMASVGGTLLSSSDATVGTYPARDLTVEKSGQIVNLRVWFVGDRFYMAMVMAPTGSVVYPEHFMSTIVVSAP
jgi:hypothetical protein